MKIIIETIPHAEQRFVTVGDFFTDPDGTRHILVSSLNDEPMEMLVALHELVEMFVTEACGIAETDILAFDVTHPELEDPGADRRAPYHPEHIFAECIERLVAARMGIEWAEYDAAVQAL